MIVAVKVSRREERADLVEPCTKILNDLGIKKQQSTPNESALKGECLDVIWSLQNDGNAFSYQCTPNGHFFLFDKEMVLQNFECYCNSFGLNYEFIGDSGGSQPFEQTPKIYWEFIEYI